MSRFSLSIRLTLFFSLIVLLVTTTLSAVVFYQFGEKINQQIERNLTGIADHKAAEISNVLLFERTNLLSWRASSVMPDVVVDDLDKRITTELLNLKQYYQLQGDLYVFNAAGVLIASTQPDVLKTQLPQTWQTQQDYALIFKHEVPFIKDSVIAHVTALKPPQLKTQGYLVMTHSWEDISRLLAPTDSSFALHKAHGGNQGSAELFTTNGVQTIEIKDDFSERPLWLFDGISYLGSISKPVTVGDFSFQIAAFMPEQLAQEPLLELTKNLLLAAALVGIPMLLLVVLLSRLLVTPIKKLQSAQTQLVQSEKMASLGQLVAGIAHEINNPIGAIYANIPPLEEYINAIKGTVEFAQSCMAEPDVQKLTAHMEQIDYDFVTGDLAKLLNSQKQAADRIRNIVLPLRNFSRLDQGEVKTVQLEEGLDSTLQMLHHNYKDRIVIEKDYALNEPVECYAGEMNRVFMNILANAIQAIPGKGRIMIGTAKVNDQAVVSIADTGTGMPDEVKQKIFAPFFTTKEVGEGTGLGLSISYGIIEKHQGTLTVESELNRGTRFVITIPLRLIKDA
jgi:signal transduction histidine kinase